MKTTEKVPQNSGKPHFLLGLAIALSLSLCALEWGVKSNIQRFIGATEDSTDDWIIEDLPRVTMRDSKLPEPPKAKQKPQPVAAVVTQVLVASNDLPDDLLRDPSDLPDFSDLDFSELTPDEVFEDDIPRQPWMLTEKPSFPGGQEAFEKFLGDNLTYPRRALDAKISGIVALSFVIDKDGKVMEESVKVMRSPSDDLSKEAIRVLLAMPNWNPGKQGVYPVPVTLKLPISFRTR